MSKPALGRGLRALLTAAPAAEERKEPGKPAAAAPAAPAGSEIPLDQIEVNPQQVRKKFAEEELQQLADTISQYGIIEPIIVHRRGSKYQLIAGERRFRAAQRLGLKTIPAVVKELVTGKEQAVISLIENIQRVELNALEEAQGYQDLIEKYGFTHEQAAASVSKSRSAVTNTLRLLQLPPAVKEALGEGSLSAGHARALAGLRTPAEQLKIFKIVTERHLSVRQTEDLIKAPAANPGETGKKSDPDVAALEEELSYIFGSKIAIASRQGRGAIKIPFRSLEDLDRLLALVRRLKIKK